MIIDRRNLGSNRDKNDVVGVSMWLDLTMVTAGDIILMGEIKHNVFYDPLKLGHKVRPVYASGDPFEWVEDLDELGFTIGVWDEATQTVDVAALANTSKHLYDIHTSDKDLSVACLVTKNFVAGLVLLHGTGVRLDPKREIGEVI